MNKNQKNVLLGFVACMLLSIVYVPQEMVIGNSSDFMGYIFITELSWSISIKQIFVEWVGIILISFALFKYFED